MPKSLLTELTAHVRVSPLPGCLPLMTHTQAPHPPSKHMYLVAVNCTYSRIKVLRVISGGKLIRFTEITKIS